MSVRNLVGVSSNEWWALCKWLCAFWTNVKIPYNLSIFTHEARWYADGTVFIALFCVYAQKVYDLKIYVM